MPTHAEREATEADDTVEQTEAAEKDARASAAERHLPRCHACWNPQFCRFRPIQHTYSGDCKFTPPSPTAAASTAAAAATAAAMAISLPRSQGSLFGSAVSDTEEQSLPKMPERHPLSVAGADASQSGGAVPPGWETVWQLGDPFDRSQRRDFGRHRQYSCRHHSSQYSNREQLQHLRNA